MAKTTKLRPWTTEDVRTLKTLAREKTRHETAVILKTFGDIPPDFDMA